MQTIRLGVDIGGTFTDLVLLHEQTGEFMVIKVPSRPRDPAGALADSVERALTQAKAERGAVKLLNHGTTIVTNAVLEGTLAKTALIATEGFIDVLEIGRHLRPDMYDLYQDKPKPMATRDLRFGVKERMGPDGEVVFPLDRDSLKSVIESVKGSGVSAVAISLLHSYANAEHEIAIKNAVEAALPELAVSASSDVCREIREFERTSTVTLNASAQPVVANYLAILEERMSTLLPEAQVLFMQSNGGSMTVAAARKTPAHLIYSGPAGGALACQFVGRMTGRENVMGFDMGGTSTDIAVVHRGEPVMTNEADVFGYPVKLPVIDINTIGAGGGSIAWLDSGGVLRVGPRSAGADPGPVAYGKGGTEATVTDANLVLGRLSPGQFLGGEMSLDKDASLAAIKKKIADPLGMDPIEAADGILRIANANMERALKVSSAERGYHPRDFTLIGFGGGGPVHSTAVAREVGFPTVLIPEAPGVFSAFGLLISDIRHDFVRSYISQADKVSREKLGSVFEELEALGVRALEQDHIGRERWKFQRTADLRYVGQAYEVNVPVPEGDVDEAFMAGVISCFHAEHDRLFAHSSESDPVEFVSLRLVATGTVDAPTLRSQEAASGPVQASSRRQVYFEETGFVDCPVFERSELKPGAEFTGPAIIEQLDSTTVVHPGMGLTVDEWGNMIIEVGGES